MLTSIGINSLGNPWSQTYRKKGRLWWEGFAKSCLYQYHIKVCQHTERFQAKFHHLHRRRCEGMMLWH